MFPVSDFAKQLIRSDDRRFDWSGKIIFADGTVKNFDMSNIVQGTGVLRSSCNAPGIGDVVSTELSMQMLLDIDIERLKNAVITLNCLVASESVIDTWCGASAYSWQDVSGVEWGANPKIISTTIPMGVFNVVQAKRRSLGVSITSYDNTQKFDVEYNDIDNVARTPYNWLVWACERCGVDIGMTNEEVKAFPNGTRLLSYATVNNDMKTYRHIIQRIASALCSVAIMDRFGRLKLVPCVSESILEFSPQDRYSSEFEDYKTSFTGIYLQHKPSSTQKYYTNAHEPEEDNGSIIDLGANPFLQISVDIVRDASIMAIIDRFKDFIITPFEMSIPFDPTIELMDVVSFTGNHAPDNAFAPITDFTIQINGDMNIRCEANETSADLLRADKVIDGVSGSADGGPTYGNTSFWLIASSYPSTQTSISNEGTTNTLDVELTVEKSRVQIAWTGSYTLTANAIVTAKVYVNNTLIYTVSDMQTAGQHSLNVTTGHDISGTGTYKFKIVLDVSSGSLTLQEKSARLTVLGYGWYGSVTSGESWTEGGQILKDIADLLSYDYPNDVDWDSIAQDFNYDSISDADGISVDSDSFNQAVEYFDTNYPDRSHGLKYKIKKYKNKNYVNVNQEGTSGDNNPPYSIKITTPPNRIYFESGEDIDITGMVIMAYDVANDIWTSDLYPDGIVPNDELVMSPTKCGGDVPEEENNDNP